MSSLSGFEPGGQGEPATCRRVEFRPGGSRRPASQAGAGTNGSHHSGAMRSAILSGAQTLSFDAASDQDLDQIAAEALAMDGRILWVGSGGLAAALARSLPTHPASGRAELAKGPVLFCIGSDHAVTAGQQETLIANRPVRIFPWEQASRERIQEALGQREHVGLRIPRDPTLCEKLRQLIEGAPAAAVFVSGGDTASLVCQALGVQHIDLYHEIVPGIPCGVFGGGVFDGMVVATKSGGFGNADALVQVADYFLCPTNRDSADHCANGRRPCRHRSRSGPQSPCGSGTRAIGSLDRGGGFARPKNGRANDRIGACIGGAARCSRPD